MKRCTVRLGLSLMLAAGWWVQRLPAQAPAAPAPAVAPAPVAPAAPTPMMAPAQAPCCGAGAGVADGMPGPPGPQSRLQRALNRCGLGCFTTHNVPGCGSLHSELTFMFGSCRQFFGEPCFARPLPYPVPAYGQYGH